MNTEGVERIVVAEAGFDLRDHEIAEDSGCESNEQGRHWAYETGCRCDGDQAGDCTGDGAQRARLTVAQPLSARPPDNCGCGCEVRSHKRAGREIAGRQRTSGIEAEPSYPRKAGSDKAEHDAMRRHSLAWIAETASQINCTDQGRDSRSDVYDRAPGEIECGESPAQSGIQETTFSPNHVGHGIVDQNGPQHHEDNHGAELHALGKCTCDKRGRDDGEHELVHHESLLWNGGRVIGIGLRSDAVQKKMVEVADETIARTERKAVTEQRP